MPTSGSSQALVVPGQVRIAGILGGLSRALDITEGHPQGHAARACLIGMRIAAVVQLQESDQADLFYALLLKDAGCSSNAARVHQLFGGDDLMAKRAVWLRDWRRLSEKMAYGLAYAGRGQATWRRMWRVLSLAAGGSHAEQQLFQVRCDRGAAIARDLGLSEATAEAIRSMDEHWDGGGQPSGLRGAQIPLAAQIVGLAQVLEIFAHEHGAQAAFDVASRRSGRWFDPALVSAARSFAYDTSFWQALRTTDPLELLARDEPVPSAVTIGAERLDRIAAAFGSVIDAKSPYTYDHSRRVSEYAVAIGQKLGFSADALVRVRRAALLHDIGKLGVPNNILDKPAALTPAEWLVVRRHPQYTYEILSAVPVFEELAFDASCHHERLNGSGYHAGLYAAGLSPTARLLAVADITDALLADRPYRAGRPRDEAVAILRAESRRGELCCSSVTAMVDALERDQLPMRRPAAPSPASGRTLDWQLMTG